MNELVMIDWLAEHKVYGLSAYGQIGITARNADEAVRTAKATSKRVAANEMMDGQKLVELMAAAIFQRVPLYDSAGKELTASHVPDAKVSYLTRKELGPILPHNWIVECQLNRYAGCLGEEITLPYRKTLEAAIVDIRAHIAAGIAQGASELAASLAAELTQQAMALD